MRATLMAVAMLAACATDDLEPSEHVPGDVCASSTLSETEPMWEACRAVDVDSWPVVCEDGEIPPPCVFETSFQNTNGETVAVLCRPAGVCE